MLRKRQITKCNPLIVFLFNLVIVNDTYRIFLWAYKYKKKKYTHRIS